MIVNIRPQKMIVKANMAAGELMSARGSVIVKARLIVTKNGIVRGICSFVIVLNSHKDIPVIPTMSDN